MSGLIADKLSTLNDSVNHFVAEQLVHNHDDVDDSSILLNTLPALANQAAITHKLFPTTKDEVKEILIAVRKGHIQLIQMSVILLVCTMLGYFRFSLTFIIFISGCLLWSIYHQRYRTGVHHAIHLQQRCYDPNYIMEQFHGANAINNNFNITVADSIDNASNATSIAENQKKVLLEHGDAPDPWMIIGAKHNTLPSWLTFPDVQKVDWLQDTMQRLWSTLKVCVQDTALASVQPILDANKPAFLSSISFAELDLGDRPPNVTGIRFHPPQDEPATELMLDMDVRLANNPVVAVKAKAGPAAVTVELADLLVEASIRVVLKPLVTTWPLFSAMSISFVRKPSIKFRVETGDMNIMAIPGLNDWIYEFTSITLASFAVWPRKIVVPILDVPKDTLKELWSEAEPLGMVFIKLIGCTDLSLPSTHIGKCDPVAHITIQDRELKKSPVVHNTKSPIWNYECELMVYDTVSDEIFIDIRNHETSGSSKLGDVTIPIHALDIINNTSQQLSLPLCNTAKQSGHIELIARYVAFKKDTRKQLAKQMRSNSDADVDADDVIDGDTSPAQQAVKLTQRTTQPSNAKSSLLGTTTDKLLGREGQSKALVIITINQIQIGHGTSGANTPVEAEPRTSAEKSKVGLIRGMSQKLKISSSSDTIKTKDVSAFVVITHGQQTYKSNVTKSDASRVLKFEQQFEFQIPYSDKGIMNVQVKRHKIGTGNNDLLGDCTINLRDLFSSNNNSSRTTKEFELQHCTHKSFSQATLFTTILYKPM